MRDIKKVEDLSKEPIEVAVAVHEEVKGLSRVGGVSFVVDFAAYLGRPYF